MTFSVTVRDHLMIAHSLRGDVFGPAQRLHGATFLVSGIVGALSYRNLDDEPALQGVNTTTERLCQVIGDELAARAREGAVGPSRLTGIAVTLHESHIAWASYEVAM